MLDGILRVTLDGEAEDAGAGGRGPWCRAQAARFGASNLTAEPATAWVTPTAGFGWLSCRTEDLDSTPPGPADRPSKHRPLNQDAAGTLTVSGQD